MSEVKKQSRKYVSEIQSGAKFPSGNELNFFGFNLKKLLHPSACERVKSSRFLA
ncbi:hypothetical protein J8I26_13875 [Herbaspirillum sp. LeCh32-8]|nr:hypothetical protein [Herbaspirillum sp. LeCh32-8]